MKRTQIILIFLLILCTYLIASDLNNHYLDPYNPEYVPGEILIKFTDDTEIEVTDKEGEISVGINKIDALLQKYNISAMEKVFRNAEKRKEQTFIRDFKGKEIEVLQLFNIYKLIVHEETDIEKAIKEFEKEPTVDYAEPNYLFYTMETYPDDPYYTGGSQWYIDEVEAPAAWDSTTCDTSQIIAVIDTGVDWDHPDLDANIWNNNDEIPGNSIDDDGNGYVDDIHGWDYVNDDNDPNDDNSHGTHVVGIAAAESNNGIGITGIAWNARIMPVKTLQSSGAGSSSDIASAIEYAYNNEATVINMSLGSYGESMTVKTALENAYAYSVLVAAAGNDGCKVDPPYPPWPPYAPMYPACYGFVIGVEATTQAGGKAGFSNFDPSGPFVAANAYGHNYEIKAPGVNIYSTFPNGNYNSLNGTSMASPIVAGAVALMKSYNPAQSTEQLFARLIQGADNGILDIGSSLDYELVPDLHYVEYTLVDTLPGCDSDGIADAGETVEIYLAVKNSGGWADSVWSKLRFGAFEDTTVADIEDSTSYIGDISAYATLTGVLDPFRVSIDPDVVNNRDIVFEYEIGAANHSSFTGELIITVQNGFEIGGVILENTVYTPDKMYILTNNLRIAEGCTLTIKPGTTIKFNPEKQIDIRGSFISNGTPDSMITFTRNQSELGKGLYSRNSTDSSLIDISYSVFKYQLVAFDGWAPRSKILIKDCIFEYCGISSAYTYFSLYGGYSNEKYLYRNNFHNNEGVIRFAQSYYYPQHVIKHNIFTNNTTEYSIPIVLSNEITTYINKLTINYNSIFSNYVEQEDREINLAVQGEESYINVTENYWGRADSSNIQSTIFDFYNNASYPCAIFSPFLTQPSDSAHSIVYKVNINDVLINKYDNPYNSPTGLGIVGCENLKFDVYFNRAMDPDYEPFLTFGVREPYTQHIVQDNSSWSADSTVWTAYYDVGLETGDGINTIRVANARDMDHFEIPIEDQRFEFVIQAAGAASIEFIATAGIGKVDLEWPIAETDDVLGYNMYRYENITDSTFSDTTLINEILITDSTYTDFNVIPDTTYHYLYKIVGTDMVESDFSKVVTAVPFSAANGDANGDLSVNVLDITSIVAYMLNQDPQPFLFDAADVNYDGSINVLDIIGVVNIILGSKPAIYASTESATIRLKDNVLELESTGNVAGLQFELTGNNLEEIKLISQMEGFELATSIKNERLIGIIYNLTGKTLPKGIISLVEIESDHKIELSKVIAGNYIGTSLQITIDDGSMLIPDRFIMHQNYPNPFKNTTKIEYALAKPSRVTMSIYNIRGQLVKRFKVGDQNPGYYDIVWNGKDEHGHHVGNGVYFYKLKANIQEGGSFEKIKKVLIIR